jgi:hypothetical protein
VTARNPNRLAIAATAVEAVIVPLVTAALLALPAFVLPRVRCGDAARNGDA